MSHIKILHMADVHFGRPVSGLSEKMRNIRRQEVRSAFSDAVSFAREQNVDVVLIAGDLFDGAHIDKSTVDFIKGELEKIRHIPVFVAPGNHDPYGSAYKMLVECGIENLTVFGAEAECKEFPDKNFAVYGIGFANEVQEEPLINKLKVKDHNLINIAVVHGEMASSGTYNPITESDIASSGMDYIALGHVHTYSGIQKAADTRYAYCGTLEGGGFDECGEKGVIWGTVSKDGCNLEFRRMCRRCYRTVEIDVTDCGTFQEIIEKVKNNTKNKDDLYKIILTGERCEKIPEEVIVNEIGAFFSKVKDLTRGAYNLDEISKDYTIGGIFAKNVLERMKNCTDEEKSDLIKAADVVFDILSSRS